jgi:GNAT superfamily N-acetyltransferase
VIQVLSYNTPQDFLNRNREYIYADYFSHYHLIHKIEELKRRKAELYDFYNIVDDNGSFVLCMWVTGAYFIYAKSWTPEIVSKLSEKIDLRKFKRFSFCGQRQLIKEFFAKNEIEGEVFKNRRIEVCEAVNPPAMPFEGQIENGEMKDIEELIRMDYDYNQEEFRGKGSQTRNDIVASIKNAIINNTIFLWRINGVITSIARHINDHDDYAIIGSLYTRPEHRGNGYGYFLMHSFTNGLLSNGYSKCGLVSDADNPITKRMFERVGYKAIFDWVLMRKEL